MGGRDIEGTKGCFQERDASANRIVAYVQWSSYIPSASPVVLAVLPYPVLHLGPFYTKAHILVLYLNFSSGSTALQCRIPSG